MVPINMLLSQGIEWNAGLEKLTRVKISNTKTFARDILGTI